MDVGPRGRARDRQSPPTTAFCGLLLALAVVFVTLGSWQVQRLFWKIDLIARVEARIHAKPVAVPSRTEWNGLSAEKDEYRRVTATGEFMHNHQVLVQAVTELGPGFWVITPMFLPHRTIVMINRGFVPGDRRAAAAHIAHDRIPVANVTGLLRMPEPGGAFLRDNDPAAGRWYSRDVAAIADAQGLHNVAPYFVDADATPNRGGLPIGGLTVVSFRNSHLAYAATWYLLAIMCGGGIYVIRRQRPV